jgi:SAM-dependent methyltransferase
MAGTSVDPVTLNAGLWRRGAWVRAYDHERLSPAEIRLLLHGREALAGRVLELGPGAGRVTTYLADLATELTALELSPAMAEACRRRVPSARVEVRDMRDLDDFGDGAFDAVVGSCNVLDVLDDPERRALLGRLRRVLTPRGVLQFSSHTTRGACRGSRATCAGRARWPATWCASPRACATTGASGRSSATSTTTRCATTRRTASPCCCTTSLRGRSGRSSPTPASRWSSA